MVQVIADSDNVDSKSEDYFKDFDVVCVTECTINQMKRINDACRKYNNKFFAGDVWGTFGFTFADLITHEFAE
jgi:ubiquitin-like 1-activating enzyme E1 A